MENGLSGPLPTTIGRTTNLEILSASGPECTEIAVRLRRDRSNGQEWPQKRLVDPHGPNRISSSRGAKGRACKRADLANVSSCRFFVPLFRFLYPRSGFLYRRSLFHALVPVSLGVQENRQMALSPSQEPCLSILFKGFRGLE